MPDVFISYSVKDEEIAKSIHEQLKLKSLDVFLAPINLQPGHHWTPQIMDALRRSDWVFLLATKDALASANVQQEVGGAIFGKKKLVPIMWDVEPSELPRWISDYQGLVLKGATIEEIGLRVTELADKVKASKINGLAFAGVLIAVLLALGSSS
ncbi:MAG: toll/interleukin-1 receptor domain-containing protein [Pseudomonadota bacterium]